MSYTLGEAAKATGRSKSTILRAIAAGKISATKDVASGSWTIEPAELHRVYPAGVAKEQPVTIHATEDDVAALRTLLDELRQERERERRQLEGVIDDLRNRLDSVDEERRTTLRQLTALLTDRRATPAEADDAPPPAKRRWRLWGRG
jgi:excisionase family DNA binding protein